MLSSTLLFSLSFWSFLLASITYFLFLILRKAAFGWLATFITTIASLFITLALIYRTIESGHPPLSNMYESLLLFSGAIVWIYLIMEFLYKVKIMGAFVVPLGFLGLLCAWLLPEKYKVMEPLVPALQSNWLWIHVITCFMGYAGFALAFGLSIMYLLKIWAVRREEKVSFLSRLPEVELLDTLSYKCIAVGFPFLALGIITGAIWANYAWGTYWSWDPKETWSLITWLIYAVYLHARVTVGWRGKRAAYISIAGFATVLFTYFGVSFLLSGLHVYV